MTPSPSSPGPSEAQLRRRRRITYAAMAAILVGVSGWHARDAYLRGQPVWPVLMALPVMGFILWLTTRFLARPVEGMTPAEARRTRAQQLMRRTAPLAIGCLLLAAVLQRCQGR